MRTVNIHLPTSWNDLTQLQLRFLLASIMNHRSYGDDPESRLYAVQTECFLRLARLRIICPCGDGYMFRFTDKTRKNERPFPLSASQIHAAVSSLDWIRMIPESPVRIEILGDYKAAEADLSDLSMEEYMACDNLWQGYAFTDNESCLEDMTRILYRTTETTTIPDIFRLSTFYWFASVKRKFSAMFPDFMQPAPAGTEATPPSMDEMRRNTDTQLRALTKGDITKENEILRSPCVRALTELDALAREYRQLKAQLKT